MANGQMEFDFGPYSEEGEFAVGLMAALREAGAFVNDTEMSVSPCPPSTLANPETLAALSRSIIASLRDADIYDGLRMHYSPSDLAWVIVDCFSGTAGLGVNAGVSMDAFVSALTPFIDIHLSIAWGGDEVTLHLTAD